MIAPISDHEAVSDEQEDKSIQNTINTILEDAIDSGKFLGLSFVVIDGEGRKIYSAAHGKQSFTDDKPMTLDTAGWMASMTKVMTSIAAMHCVERGLIGLDDDLAFVVPEFRDIKVITGFDSEIQTASFEELKEKITLRRLLSHSSGFAYDQWNERLMAWAKANGKHEDMRSGEWKAWIRPLCFQPDQGWLYSQGIDWAGKVVELVTNETLESYMSANIWTPLGMHNTTFHPETRDSFSRLDFGLRLNGPDKPLSPGHSPWPLPVKDDMGGCGVYSTAEDYSRLLSALLSKDGRLIKQSTIDTLFSPQLSEQSRKELAIARGLGLVQIDIPDTISVDHALGGLLVAEDIPGRRKKGSMCWDGMSNPNWMVDRTVGYTCVLFTQILPCPDPATKELWTKLESAVYEHVYGKVSDN